MTTHKAIREALEAATKNGWQTHVVDNDRLRALLADLDAKTEALNLVADYIRTMKGQGHEYTTTIDAALKGTP